MARCEYIHVRSYAASMRHNGPEKDSRSQSAVPRPVQSFPELVSLIVSLSTAKLAYNDGLF